ncbi:MAG: hypothetical protein NT069_18810, partial [Planctomycetota bacterium]|nr:hypothetical protein [Planctomycetota bacterium]
GQDPADYLNDHGADALRELLRNSTEAWEYKYRQVVERYGLDSIDSRHRVMQEMLEILAEVPVAEGAGLAAKWKEREQIILGRLAQRLKVGEAFIRDRLSDLRTSQQQKGLAPRPVERPVEEPLPVTNTIPPLPKKPSRDERAEIDLLMALFTHPAQASRAAKELSPADFTHHGLRRLYETCLIVHAREQPPSFDRVSLAIDESNLLRLAVEIDEIARSANPTEDLMDHTLAYFRRRHELEFHSTEPTNELAEDPVDAVPSADGSSELNESMRERLRRATQYNGTRIRRAAPSSAPSGESPNAPAR